MPPSGHDATAGLLDMGSPNNGSPNDSPSPIYRSAFEIESVLDPAQPPLIVLWLQQQWSSAKHWNWNAIIASFIAVFFFVLWSTSPAGRFVRQHAACPVAVPILDLTPIASEHRRRHELQRAVTQRVQGREVEGAIPVSAEVKPTCPVCPTSVERSDPTWTNGSAEPIVSRHAKLAVSSSSHVGIRKTVHLRSGTVPHLLQWAEASFAPQDATERHMHDTATEVFHVRSGVLTIYFDRLVEDGVDASNLTSHHSSLVHHLRARDSVTIPPRRWHKLANTHEEPLELVYTTIHTP